MKVLLDEGVPEPVARSLRGHEVTSVIAAGWESVKNGILLSMMERSDFHAFLTCDKNIEYQQSHLRRKPFGMLVLSTNHWPTLKAHLEKIVQAVNDCEPGTITYVDCGHFVPRRFRNPK